MKAAANITTAIFELPIAKRKERKKATEITSGSVTVQIFGAAPGPWTIAWYEGPGGARKRAMRSSFAKAKKFAQDKADSLANGETAAEAFTPADRASYLRVLENLKPIGANPELATAEYAQCVLQLGSTVSPLDAVRFYLENRPAGLSNKTIPQVVTEFLERKKEDGAGERWQKTLETQLLRFAEDFDCPLHIVKAVQIDAWLRNLTIKIKKVVTSTKISSRSRVNYRGAILDLANYARRSGYVPRAWDELDRVSIPKVKAIEIKILTPEQMTKLLACAPDSLKPFIALTAFAGIRHEEMNGVKANLDWRDIRLKDDLIYIPAGVGKTGTDRIIPISSNLAAWLQPHAKRNGPVCEISNTSNALFRAKTKAGIATGKNETRNTLRKSFISYRLALVKNIAQVAEEAGNSPAKIKSNYRRPIPESEAKAWFDIWPSGGAVLQINFGFKA